MAGSGSLWLSPNVTISKQPSRVDAPQKVSNPVLDE